MVKVFVHIWQAKNIVTAMHSCFNHTALDYAFQVKFCCELTKFELTSALPVHGQKVKGFLS